jgi:hypothetical protein
MRTLRSSWVLGVCVAAPLLGLPSVAKSCPRSWRASRAFGSPLTGPVVLENRSYYRGPVSPSADSAERVLPAAATRTVRPLSQPHVAPLSEQTPNDNFTYSGQ